MWDQWEQKADNMLQTKISISVEGNRQGVVTLLKFHYYLCRGIYAWLGKCLWAWRNTQKCLDGYTWRKDGKQAREEPIKLHRRAGKNIYIYSDPWVWALLSLKCKCAHFIWEKCVDVCFLMRGSPGKYLRDCCSQSRWRCCTQTDSGARASPAGGRGLLGASYWGHQEAVQTDRQYH